jgi:hypothetical protein|tara:strand:+ start:580 stop:681 length:102 start_codon:yes stop_codon:yes gene_type:complete
MYNMGKKKGNYKKTTMKVKTTVKKPKKTKKKSA